MDELEALEALLRARPASMSIEQRRDAYDALGDRFPLEADVYRRSESIGNIRGEWTLAPSANAGTVVLYLHGGGYVYGSLKSHRHLVSELGRAAGVTTFALDYRRAPEHPYPAAIDDALEAYQALLKDYEPSRVALAGDSAGGGLAVALLLKLRELGLPQPSGCLLLSPWVDMTAHANSYVANAQRDPVVNREIIQFVTTQYLGTLSRELPLASPVFADLRGIAPLAILVGATETLLDDSLALSRRAAIGDVPVTIEVWPRMFHIWATYHPVLEEGRRAVQRCGSILSAFLHASVR